MTPLDNTRQALLQAEFERGFRAGQAEADRGMGGAVVAVLLLLGAAMGAWVTAIVTL